MKTLYNNLYQSDNLRGISIRSYLEPLLDDIVDALAGGIQISLEKDIADVAARSR